MPEDLQSNITEMDMGENNVLAFEAPEEQSSYIKVIGVGGGGGNAVNHMYREGVEGVDFIVCNTDEKALQASPVPTKIYIALYGAGGKPEVARKEALKHQDDILKAISHNTQMLFVTACMGGGTGTGAAPVVASIAKSVELDDETVNRILVVGVVTVPFTFEGRRRMQQALAGIEEMRKHVDSLIVINNDKLMEGGKMTLPEAFKAADDILLTAVKGIAEVITITTYTNTDFRDVNSVMVGSGTALMGVGLGHGEDRAKEAITRALDSKLLNDNDIQGARNVLLNITFSSKAPINMEELGIITNIITDATGGDTDMSWGQGADDSLADDEIKIILVATGFHRKEERDATPNVMPLTEPAPAPYAGGDNVRTRHTDMGENRGVAATATNTATATQPITTAPGRNVYPLEDDEPATRNTVSNSQPATRINPVPADDQIQIVHRDQHSLNEAISPHPQPHVQSPNPPSTPTDYNPPTQPYTVETTMAAAVMQQTPVHTPVNIEAVVVSQPVAVVEPVIQANQQSMAPTVEAVASQPSVVAQAESPSTASSVQPQPITVPFPGYAPERSGESITERMERVRKMNQALHNDPAEPQRAQDKVAAGDIDMEVTPRGNQSDVAGQQLNDKGNMNKVSSYLFGTVD